MSNSGGDCWQSAQGTSSGWRAASARPHLLQYVSFQGSTSRQCVQIPSRVCGELQNTHGGANQRDIAALVNLLMRPGNDVIHPVLRTFVFPARDKSVFFARKVMPPYAIGMPASPCNAAHVRRRFDRAAATFDSADFVHRNTFTGILERLDPVAIAPAVIVDLGCATGSGSLELARTFRKARIVSVDLSHAMLLAAGKKRGWLSKSREVQGDVEMLPLRSASTDLVVANLLLPWVDLQRCLAEVARVLRKDGVFAFATLGPDSLMEIRRAWSREDDGRHALEFADMHDIGDALVRAGLRDPVVDVDRLVVSYRDIASLFTDLTNSGARNSLAGRRKTLTGKERFHRMRGALQEGAGSGPLEMTLELVYGHAWGGGAAGGAEFRLDPASIGVRRRQNSRSR